VSTSGVRVRLALVSALAAAALPPPAAAQQPVPGAPVVIDGPSSAILRPSGLSMSIARDGTGALVYLKQVSGVPHVFASTLVGGAFSAPVQLDAGLSVAASQPAVAAGNGGLLLFAFISGGQLFVVQRTSAQAALSAPTLMVAHAANPSLSMSSWGKAYLAFTVPDGAGDDVRSAFFVNGHWALESSPLNATPADNAGTGTGAPQVATAGDGVGIVVWGENGGVYARRVWGTSPSVVYERADGAFGGCNELAVSNPAVGTGGDSSYAVVAFEERLSCSGTQQTRVLMNRLHGSAYDGIRAAEGLTVGGSDSATEPQVTMDEYGHGFVTSESSKADNVYATVLGDNGSTQGMTQVNGATNTASPAPVPATAGLFSNLIAWQQSPGTTGLPEVRVRYAPKGDVLGPEIVISSPTQGPVDAPGGLAAAGDIYGDSAVAWLQGPPSGVEIVAAELYQPPGAPGPSPRAQYQRTSQPVLAWTAAREPWGPVTYSVSVDGTQVGQTTATSLTAPAALSDGPHSWQVTATNPAGQQAQSRAATVFIDTTPPTVALMAPRRVRLDKALNLRIAYADLPPSGASTADASGVAKVVIRWGDGSTTTVPNGSYAQSHRYRRARRYTVTVTVTDAAGNATTTDTKVRIFVPKPKPKPKTKTKTNTRSGSHK
jgi:PKD domain/Bacterial Ig-like domain